MTVAMQMLGCSHSGDFADNPSCVVMAVTSFSAAAPVLLAAEFPLFTLSWNMQVPCIFAPLGSYV